MTERHPAQDEMQAAQGEHAKFAAQREASPDDAGHLQHAADYWLGVAGNFRQERDDAIALNERMRDTLARINDKAVQLRDEIGTGSAVAELRARVQNIVEFSREHRS